MKKFMCLLGVVASALILSSCASQGTMAPGSATMDNGSAQTAAAPAHHHHDYKGEVKK